MLFDGPAYYRANPVSESKISGVMREPRRVLVSGSTGFIGRALVARLRAAGDVVVPLLRGRAEEGCVTWDPGAGGLDPGQVSGFDAVIHLAGEPVVGLWTDAKKRRILDSRSRGTRVLASALAAADEPPRVFLGASGVNFYGFEGDSILDERAPKGRGFLAEVCEAWEEAAKPLAGRARVVNMRIGVVLGAGGGSLAAMLPVFRLGLGAVVAGGRGYVSWIGLDDLLRAVDFLIEEDGPGGPVNLVAPEPVTAEVFSRAIGRALGRPVLLRVPGWPLRLVLGEMALETILGSVRAVPGKLMGAGFGFESPSVDEALLRCLRR